MSTRAEGITEKVAIQLLSLQNRCIECGSTNKLAIHHRVFRSEGDYVLRTFLQEKLEIYKKCYGKETVTYWTLHDIQNLCVLCDVQGGCHKQLHNGNSKLHKKYRESFTCPVTGFNIPFFKENLLY